MSAWLSNHKYTFFIRSAETNNVMWRRRSETHPVQSKFFPLHQSKGAFHGLWQPMTAALMVIPPRFPIDSGWLSLRTLRSLRGLCWRFSLFCNPAPCVTLFP
jgi:hypothetical protein